MRYRKPQSSFRQPTYQPRRRQQPVFRRPHVRRPFVRRGGALTRWKIYLATGKRVKYRDAGRAHRQGAAVVAKAAQSKRLSSFDRRVWEAVLVLTTSFSKTDDRIAVMQIAAFVYQRHVDKVTSKQRTKVGSSLRRLHDTGVLTYTPGSGRGLVGHVDLPVPADGDDVLRDLGITGRKVTPPGGDVPEEKGHPLSEERSPHSGDQKVTPPWGAHREVLPRSTNRGFGEVSEPDSGRDESGGPFTPERADEERNEDEDWCASVPADVRPFWVVVASHTRGKIKLQPDWSLVTAVRDAAKRSDQSARALAGSLEPGKWPTTFNQSAEAYAMWKVGRVERRRL